MSTPWSVNDLVYWDEKIREKVEEFGLVCFPQEFELCDHAEMLGYMAYSGMPSHYPHWSYGKSYEKLKTLYDYGVSGLPYEMVINSNPSLAYLMNQNSLCLQILTIAHVYGHNDFFRNNFTFKYTSPEETISGFKARADRIRGYTEDPSIGVDKVEWVMDAAHALSLQCRRNMAIRKVAREEQVDRAVDASLPDPDPYRRIHPRHEYVEPDLHKIPLEPEEDILLFVRDYNPKLAGWQKDALTIVHEQAQYFIPQMETKIMNEGWASYWHRTIMNSLDLPQEIYVEFLVRHNQVVRPIPGDINPYHIGINMWDELIRRHGGQDRENAAGNGTSGAGSPNGSNGPNGSMSGPPCAEARDFVFGVRETDRDTSFLRRFLDEEMMREMDLFAYEPYGDELVVTKVSDEESWRDVKNALIASVGTGSIPVIRIHDADHGGNRALYLLHEHDGRDLQLEYAEKTLSYLYRLWGHEVLLETVLNRKKRLLSYGEQGFAMKMIK